MPVLRFRRVSRSYDLVEHSVAALRDVSVTVGAGELVSLVGRSGCGKSTFLNLAGAMDLPTSGEVLLDGRCTRDLSDDQRTVLRRERVGFVFQFFHLLPTLSAIENVEMPLQIAGQRDVRRKAGRLLGAVGLDGLASRLPYQLSGGQMQRVAIARALAFSPPLLLADEPMGNLDTETSTEVMGVFRRINAELGATIVLATHSLETASATDRILTLSDGRIISDSPATAPGNASPAQPSRNGT